MNGESGYIFENGVQGSEDWFTGDVKINMMLPKDQNGFYSVADVKFAASSRTKWHTHPVGQVLLCTKGEGFYMQEGNDPIFLKQGDTFEIPPNVKHCHGATSKGEFVHIALTNMKDGIGVIWLEGVSDKDYEVVG